MKKQIQILVLACWSASAVAMDCSQAPEPAVCRMQARSAGVIDNLVRQTRLYQEGVFADIETRKEREAWREQKRAADAAEARASVSKPVAAAPAERPRATSAEKAMMLNALSMQRAASALEQSNAMRMMYK